MDPSDVHPDPFGEALGQSGQRLAQLGSLLTSWVMVEARRIERREAARAARSEQQLRELRAQERAAWELARAGWAPADDRRWLARAGLVEVARAWSAAAAYASADPGAATAAGRCEDRLRQLHPYAMSWYDRLRAQGAGTFDAMRDALPLFARAPHARPGDPPAQRPALMAPQATAGSAWEWGQQQEARVSPAPSAYDHRGLDAPGLAAESFPWTAADAAHAGATGSIKSAAHPRTTSARPTARPSMAP